MVSLGAVVRFIFSGSLPGLCNLAASVEEMKIQESIVVLVSNVTAGQTLAFSFSTFLSVNWNNCSRCSRNVQLVQMKSLSGAML